MCEACRGIGHQWAVCEHYGREAPCLGACPRCPRESHLPDHCPVVLDDRPAPPGRLILAQLASERGVASRGREQREILDLPGAEGTGSASSIQGGGDSNGSLPRQGIDVVATLAAHHRSKGKYVCCRCDGQEGCRRGCATIGGLTAQCVHCVKIHHPSSSKGQPGSSDSRDEVGMREACRICRRGSWQPKDHRRIEEFGGPKGAKQVLGGLGQLACEKGEELGGAPCVTEEVEECCCGVIEVRRCRHCLRLGHSSDKCPDAEELGPMARPSCTPTLVAQPGVCCARCSTLGHTEARCWVPCSCWGTEGHGDVFCARDTGAGR